MKNSQLIFYKKQTVYLLVSMMVIFLDQWSKYLAKMHLFLYAPQYISTNINLTLARNTGAAFSLFDSASGWQSMFFASLNIGISLLILGWLLSIPFKIPLEGIVNQVHKINRLKSWGLSLIFGGAWGNIIDRLRFGYVIDFLDLHFKAYHWPIFNLADTAVCIGVGLLVIAISIEDKA